MILLFFIGVGGYLLYRMPADDRTQLFERATDLARQVKETVQTRVKNDPFRRALRARTPWAVVTPALVALNVTIFILMLLGGGAFGDPDTLVAWGGSFAPRTTNGEWWRLVAAMFVHSGRLQLFVNMAALLQVGYLLERLHGGFAVATVYFAAGVFANLLTTSVNPMAVSVGASGAVCGLYGMLAVTIMFGVL